MSGQNQNQVAELFARLGFKVDMKPLNNFNKALDLLERRLASFSSAWNSTVAKANKALALQTADIQKGLNLQKEELKIERQRLDNQAKELDNRLKIQRAYTEETKQATERAKQDTQEEQKALVRQRNKTEVIRQGNLAAAESRRIELFERNKLTFLANAEAKILKDKLKTEERIAATTEKERKAQEKHNKRMEQMEADLERKRYAAANAAIRNRGRATGATGASGGLLGGLTGAALTGSRVFAPGLPGLMAGATILPGPLKALAGVGIGLWGMKQVANRGQELYGNEQAFKAVFGGPEEGNYANTNFIRQANELGIGFRDNTKNYLGLSSDMQSAGIGDKTDDVFFGFAKYGQVLGRSPEEMNKAFRALSQMAGKRQIMSEELKGQLAEAIPGAVSLFAEALTGGDTAKLFEGMQEGKFGVQELVRVGQYAGEKAEVGGGLTMAKQSMAAQQARFGNTLDLITMRMNKQGLNGAFAGMFGSMADMAETFAPLGDIFVTLTKIVDQLVGALSHVLKPLGGVVAIIDELLDAVVGGIGVVANSSFGKMLIDSFKGLFAVLELAFLWVADIIGWMTGKNSVTGNALGNFDDIFKNILTQLDEFGLKVVGFFGSLGDKVIEALKSNLPSWMIPSDGPNTGGYMGEKIAAITASPKNTSAQALMTDMLTNPMKFITGGKSSNQLTINVNAPNGVDKQAWDTMKPDIMQGIDAYLLKPAIVNYNAMETAP